MKAHFTQAHVKGVDQSVVASYKRSEAARMLAGGITQQDVLNPSRLVDVLNALLDLLGIRK